jgi:hypothetical protein
MSFRAFGPPNFMKSRVGTQGGTGEFNSFVFSDG